MTGRIKSMLWRVVRGSALAALVASLQPAACAQFCPAPYPASVQAAPGQAAQPGQTAPANQAANDLFANAGSEGSAAATCSLQSCPLSCPSSAQAAPADQAATDIFADAGNKGAVASTCSPGMIGGCFYAGVPYEYLRNPAPTPYNNTFILTPSASLLGRAKIADDNSPLPTDRVFFDYSYYQNACLSAFTNVSAFRVGFEKTLFDGQCSVELKAPMGSTQTSNVFLGYPSTYGPQFGNLEIETKTILYRSGGQTIVGGIGITCPTAPDVNVYNTPTATPGGLVATVRNQGVHLMPYVGFDAQDPSWCWFAQAFIQLDFDPFGDNVENGTSPAVSGLGPAGTRIDMLDDQTMFYEDLVIGRWLWRDDGGRRINSLALVGEIHYTEATQPPDTAVLGTGTLWLGGASQSVFDLVFGAHAVIGKTVVTLAYGFPMTLDRGYTDEIRLMVNQCF